MQGPLSMDLSTSHGPIQHDEDMAQFARVIGLLVLVLGLGLSLYIGNQYYRVSFATPTERLQILWDQDVQKLKEAKKLPAGWDDIRQIDLFPATDNAKVWLKNVTVPLQVRADGQHKMEVLILSWEESGVTGAIVQYNLVDLKTNNMIWELGRTFVLSGDPDLEKLNTKPTEKQIPAESTASPEPEASPKPVKSK
jgi:hypothetical protein